MPEALTATALPEFDAERYYARSSNMERLVLAHGRPSRSDAWAIRPVQMRLILIHSFTLSQKNNTHAQGRCPIIPQINLKPAHLAACLSPLPLPLPPSSSTALLRSARPWRCHTQF